MNIKGYQTNLVSFFVIIIPAVCWIGLMFYQTSKHALPSHVDTLVKFAAEMPKPDKVTFFEKDGLSYVEVFGPLPSFPAVPSGPPSYIFDSAGRIVYWNVDIGDSESYWRDWWQRRSNICEVSMQEALTLMQDVKH